MREEKSDAVLPNVLVCNSALPVNTVATCVAGVQPE